MHESEEVNGEGGGGIAPLSGWEGGRSRKKTLLIKRGERRWKIMRVANRDEEEYIRGLPLSASRR